MSPLQTPAGDVPHVSVVIPTQGHRTTLRRAAQSALRQTGVTTEVIVVVDRPGPDAGGEVSRLCRGLGVTVVQPGTRQGTARARNAGADAATGTWLSFLDDDDAWAPAKLGTQLDAMVAQGAAWSFVASVLIDEDRRILGRQIATADDLSGRLLESDVVPDGGSVVVSRDFFDAAGGFDPGLDAVDDWDLWIRLALAGQPAAINRPLTGHTLHHGSHTRNFVAWEQSAALIDAKYRSERSRLGRSFDWPAWHRWLASEDLRAGRRSQAARRLARSARGGGSGDWWRAAAVALIPSAAAVAASRQRSGVPAGWAAEARSWLIALDVPDSGEGSPAGAGGAETGG